MFRLILTVLFLCLVAAGGFVYVNIQDLPSIEKVVREGVNPAKWTQVFASDGSPILSYTKFRHQKVALSEVSPYFIDALIATEDRRFYSHLGIDPVAIGRAALQNVKNRQISEGGSTLTQQLARNVFLSNERSMRRKVREAVLSLKLEQELSKDEILELYINNIYFGEGAYGIHAASEIYFNKKPSQLSVDEAATLAGLPQAPSLFSPFQNPDKAKARRSEVLANMKEVGKLTPDELSRYQQQGFRLNPNGRGVASANAAPFFNRYVMEKVQAYFDLDEQTFWQSGLKIYTTLDLHAQRLADRSVRNQSAAFGRTGIKQQAALLSINPQTGGILAYVGGKNYEQSQFDRVVQATRSPGSLFKVFTYTTAFDKGYEPTRVYLDEPMQVGDWVPQNYDKSHHGYMTIARALITSNNIIAVKVLNELGPENVANTAYRMGIKSHLNPYLALTLGGSGVNLLEITSAIGVLANQGVRAEPYAVEKILDTDGRIVYQHHPVKTDVLNRTTVDTMVKILMGVIERGTGTGANIGRPAAGKTGTSDDYRDAWFVGFTPEVVTGVWVGNDDNTPMPGMTGGGLPARIWQAYMGAYLSGRPPQQLDLPYSRPLSEADFYKYNIENLSTDDLDNPYALKDPGEAQLDTEGSEPLPEGSGMYSPESYDPVFPVDPLNEDPNSSRYPAPPEATPQQPGTQPVPPQGSLPPSSNNPAAAIDPKTDQRRHRESPTPLPAQPRRLPPTNLTTLPPQPAPASPERTY